MHFAKSQANASLSVDLEGSSHLSSPSLSTRFTPPLVTARHKPEVRQYLPAVPPGRAGVASLRAPGEQEDRRPEGIWITCNFFFLVEFRFELCLNKPSFQKTNFCLIIDQEDASFEKCLVSP